MEKLCSYILLTCTFVIVLTFGAHAIQLPDSFAKRGALPTLNEWHKTFTLNII